jgi:RNA polymerase sigma-70 factor (ECF subfamily)
VNINRETAVTENRRARLPFLAGTQSKLESTQIAGAYAEGQIAWPQLTLAFDLFRAHCERVLGSTPAEGWHAHGAELYLCCACAEGDTAAHLALRRELLGRVAAALRRAHPDEELVAESIHALEIKLLVGPHAKIASYAARGPLLGWLHMAAKRSVLDQITRFRARKRWLDTSFAEEEPRHHQPDPLLGILHERYAASLLAAVKCSLQGLCLEDRKLMQQAHLEGQTIETLGEAYAIHRSTAARRLQRVRQQIADAVRRELSRTYSLSNAEFDEIAAALREQLAPALAGLLTQPALFGGVEPPKKARGSSRVQLVARLQ